MAPSAEHLPKQLLVFRGHNEVVLHAGHLQFKHLSKINARTSTNVIMLSFTTIQVTHNTKTDVAFSLYSPLLCILGFGDNEVLHWEAGVWGVGCGLCTWKTTRLDDPNMIPVSYHN